jgi:hypothetical protein
MGIKLLKVSGDYERVIGQVRDLCDAKNPRLKKHRDVVWDEIECFQRFCVEICTLGGVPHVLLTSLAHEGRT